MPRITLVFRISDASIRDDLVREFTLHDDVAARADEVDGEPVVVVETSSSPPAVWDVRATVVMFDDHSWEVRDDVAPVIQDHS